MRIIKMNVSSNIMQRICRDVELLTKNIGDSSSIKKMDTEFFEQIKESLAFIKEFVKYCVIKQRDHLNFIIEQASVEQNSEHVRIPTQFLIECIFLALLDLPDNVGGVENIMTKINEWLPVLQTGALKLVSMIESLLKSTCCFKRLTSIEKSRTKYKKPLILAKRHYFWSIDYEYLKIFVRYFEGIRIFQRSDYATEVASTACEIESNKTNTNTFFLLPKTMLINSNNPAKCVAIQSFPPVHSKLFDSWKILVDRYKALMEIKHKRLNWILQSSFFFSPSQNPVRFDQLDFVKLVRFKNDNHKKSRAMQKEENKHRPSRTITKRLINIPMINKNTNEKTSMEEVAIKVRKREPRAPPPSPQKC